MGTNIKDLLVMKEVDFKYFNGKILAVDGFNILYQFISTIRQRDGSLLKDSKGQVTSHLTGLFSRTTKLMKFGIKFRVGSENFCSKIQYITKLEGSNSANLVT